MYDVFQYEAKINIDEVRKTLVDLIRECIESRTSLTQQEFRRRMPQRYRGSYPMKYERSAETSVDALLWKCSELTGKYCGCQYWSVKAKELFDVTIDKRVGGRLPTPRDAGEITRSLQKKTQPNHQRIVHEHVFPRGDFIRRLLSLSNCDGLDALIGRLGIGCIVLGSEDNQLDRYIGDFDNPWLRYKKAKIRLLNNPNWDPFQRVWIEAAGLL